MSESVNEPLVHSQVAVESRILQDTMPQEADFQAAKNPENLDLTGESEKPDTKPGFLCMALPDFNQDEACKCQSKNSCSNVHCIIQHHMQNRPYMRRTYKDQSGMIIVPIEKSYDQDFAYDEVDEIDGEDLDGEVEFASETPSGAMETSETPSGAMETSETPSGAIETSKTPALCKDIDDLIKTKLKQMTNLEKPSTTEELALFLQATNSDEFRQMLADKYDEVAASENGPEKVKIITTYYGNRNR